MFKMVSPNYDHFAAKEFFAASVHSSIDYLIDFYELSDVSKSPPLSWQMCAAHYLAAKCAEADDHEGAVKYLRYLNMIPAVKAISISPLSSSDLSFDKEMILKIIKDDRELSFGFCDDLELATGEAKKIDAALDMIRIYAPVAYKEIATFLHTVYLTRETDDGSRFMRSGTNFYMWGMVFVYIHEEHSVPYYVDILAHECGHTALNILNSFDALVLNNPLQTYEAPLRVDHRPMIGIFHAFFVMSRICYVFEQIIQDGSSPYFEECLERFSTTFSKLQNTHTIVKQHALFTDIGHGIYRDICKLWKLD